MKTNAWQVPSPAFPPAKPNFDLKSNHSALRYQGFQCLLRHGPLRQPNSQYGNFSKQKKRGVGQRGAAFDKSNPILIMKHVFTNSTTLLLFAVPHSESRLRTNLKTPMA